VSNARADGADLRRQVRRQRQTGRAAARGAAVSDRRNHQRDGTGTQPQSVPGRRQAQPWHNRLIWGGKNYLLQSLLPEFAGNVNLIYIDPPLATQCDRATLPRAVVFHDWFVSALQPFLSEHFRRIAFVRHDDFLVEVIEHERPEVVI
jgi:hypothetical protein